MTNNVVEWLLKEGCPSIVYRVRKEIKEENVSEQEYKKYETLICSETKVQRILSWQDSAGYFGTRLHTAPSRSKVWTHEGCVRYLIEMGLSNDNEYLRKALDAMLCPGWGKECENSKAASVFKYEMIRASLFAQAGLHNYDFVPQWVEDALQGFRYIADSDNYMDLVCKRTDQKLVFQGVKYIPTIYHLWLLAFTDFWRTEENKKMLETAYRKLYQWLPLPPMYHQSKSYPVAPLGNVCWAVNQDFDENMGFHWIHFYELSARMGMLGKNSPFRKHFDKLKEDVLGNEDYLTEYTKKKNNSYVGWSGYSGLSLDGDGETQQQRMRDFMFRVLLIDKYSDKSVREE